MIHFSKFGNLFGENTIRSFKLSFNRLRFNYPSYVLQTMLSKCVKRVLCTQLTSFIRSYDLVTFKSSGHKRVYLINKHHYESTEVTMINFKYAVIYISVIPCVLAKEIKKKNVNITEILQCSQHCRP